MRLVKYTKRVGGKTDELNTSAVAELNTYFVNSDETKLPLMSTQKVCWP